jgi:uncharacterized membrane protein
MQLFDVNLRILGIQHLFNRGNLKASSMKLNAWIKVLIALGLSFVLFSTFMLTDGHLLTSIMLGWEVFALSMVVLNWITFYKTSSRDIRQQAQFQDESRYVVFTIVLACIVISFSGILILLNADDHNLINRSIHLPVSFVGVALSWILLHTIFALHYAHLFYGDDKMQPGTHAGGLRFPGDNEPGYLDFAYFSFIIGMTFQVSDVSISSKMIRKVVLFHSLISFAFNTVIVALTISLITGMKG